MIVEISLASSIIASVLLLPAIALGHDMDVNQARQKVEAYARRVGIERGYNYITPSCTKTFPHRVHCFVYYQNETTKAANRNSCVEEITVYFQAHRGDKRNWEYYMTHFGRNGYPPNPCGNEELKGPMP